LAKPKVLPQCWLVSAHQDALDQDHQMVRHYGCHDRADYLPTYPAQDGWIRTADSAVAKIVDIEFNGSKACNYKLTELGKIDPLCDGCIWKSKK